MAITLDQISSIGSAVVGVDPSFSVTVGSGSDRILVLATSCTGGNAITGATFNGLPLTAVFTYHHSSNANGAVALWYLVNPPVGTFTLQFAKSSAGALSYVASSWNGVNQSTPFGTPQQTESTTGHPLTSPAYNSSAGRVLIDVTSPISRNTNTLNAGQTSIALVNDVAPRLAVSYKDAINGGNTTGSTISSSGFWNQGLVEMLPSGAVSSNFKPIVIII